MQLTTIFAAIISSLVASAQVSINARAPAADPQVIFFDSLDLSGKSYVPANLVAGACSTLPVDWAGKPESVLIGVGFSCTFFTSPNCEGTGIAHSGNVYQLEPQLNNSIESFSCTQTPVV